MINRICVNCQNNFEVMPSVVRKGKGNYCSRFCVKEAKADRIAKTPLSTRFWRKVRKTDTCWEWTGAKSRKGYGQISIGAGRHRIAHRVSYELYSGKRPLGIILHMCDNPSCVNPAHLREGTQLENMQDMVNKHRQEHGERHHNAKLSSDDVINIHVLLTQSVAGNKIAKQYGVSESTICDIRKGRTWTHI